MHMHAYKCVAMYFYIYILLFTGWTCCYSSTIILSIDCFEYVDNLEDAFHPYKLNGSERQLDYCTKCLCDEVCVYMVTSNACRSYSTCYNPVA